MTLPDLDALLTMLRHHGVQSFSDGDLSLCFYPAPQAPPAVQPSPPTPIAEPSAPVEPPPMLCPCGHDMVTDHNENGCLFGCADELCEGSPLAPAT